MVSLSVNHACICDFGNGQFWWLPEVGTVSLGTSFCNFVAFHFNTSLLTVPYFEYQKTSESVLKVIGHVVVSGICVFLLHSVVKFSKYTSFSKKHLGHRGAANGLICSPQDEELWVQLWQGLRNSDTICSYNYPSWAEPLWWVGVCSQHVGGGI